MTGGSRCPKCGAEVYMPVKSWSLKPRSRGGSSLYIMLYECPRCFARWRVVEKVGSAGR